ncbi:MAG: hypothetical protein J0J01_00690 [Reyranella sp.]|uniref:hypothetical protein n=1 Tax=Reyranella sp. TaxID=1929291 RepID=UPI001AC6789D|nr:hypothetical protein [Reyranella sp.]MBN9085396.1 hypothetical protein [Reyranella sp.]
MLQRLLSAALASVLLLITGSTAFAYYSKDSYEGDVTFTGRVEIADDTPDFLIIPSYVSRQLLYLAGPLGAAPRKSAAKSDGHIDILGKDRDSKTGKLYVRYRYTGTFVLDNELQDVVKIRLPLHLEDIWERSSDECFSWGSIYRMAYFWNPSGKGCKLVDGVDYLSTDAAIVRKLANTSNTMPAYERLTDSNGEIRMVLAFGADKDHKGKLPPDTSDDYNAANYRDARKFLLGQGFSAVTIPVDVRVRECGTAKSLATSPGYVEEFVRKDAGRKIVVRLFWGVANIGDESNAFFCMAKEAAERGSVFLYSGHSRVGGLDLDYMSSQIGSPIKANHSQYQIYGFFGCSSYSYYNLSYFAAKASKADPDGTKNADIITNGVTGSFYAMADFSIKTVAPILNWSARGSRMSWQQIMGSYSKKFLTGVNGDE